MSPSRRLFILNGAEAETRYRESQNCRSVAQSKSHVEVQVRDQGIATIREIGRNVPLHGLLINDRVGKLARGAIKKSAIAGSKLDEQSN